MRSLVAGSNVAGASAASISSLQVRLQPGAQLLPAAGERQAAALRTNSGAPTAVVSRRSAALTAGWVR